MGSLLEPRVGPQRAKVKHLYDPEVVCVFKVGQADGENALDILEWQPKARGHRAGW